MNKRPEVYAKIILHGIKEDDPSGFSPCPPQRAEVIAVSDSPWGVSVMVLIYEGDREGPDDDGLREFTLEDNMIEDGATWS